MSDETRDNTKHPIQPLELVDGIIRFKENEIVRYLLDNGGIDMNDLGIKDFSREDREQFAQLIGYSYSGACELSYMSDEVLGAANCIHEEGLSEKDARIAQLENKLREICLGLKKAACSAFHIHPDDLQP